MAPLDDVKMYLNIIMYLLKMYLLLMLIILMEN